jgi:hypothetical protein
MRKLFRNYEPAIAVVVGILYGLYTAAFSMIVCGSDHGTEKANCTLFAYSLFYTGLGPFGLGYALLLYIAYRRYRMVTLIWICLGITGAIITTQKKFGTLPNTQQMMKLLGELTRDPVSVIFLFIPHVLVFSLVCFWLLTPRPRKEPKIVSKSTDLP